MNRRQFQRLLTFIRADALTSCEKHFLSHGQPALRAPPTGRAKRPAAGQPRGNLSHGQPALRAPPTGRAKRPAAGQPRAESNAYEKRLIFDFFAGFLIDHFHGQAHFAPVIKAKQFHFHGITFLHHI